ncbi:MAG: hydrogenase nickel incorporation protein HypB [Candidatus Izemoplasmatales bacterium]|nr:hydrogenase nickel incorporation protein HypB [Candidatus Izemoplasmatales bacterium]
MEQLKVIEIQKNVYAKNDEEAAKVRAEVKQKGVYLMNLMSSPGSGKTTTLVRTIQHLKEKLNIGIIEADIDSDVDAKTIATTGAKVIQLHTGGMCHLDANMTRQGLDILETDGLDLVVLENIGNLVCPASFDTGATLNVMILSVPEGDDKPLKYPKMFKVVDVLLINKLDAIGYFDFDLNAVIERAKALNPNIVIFPMSAKLNQGIDAWCDWLEHAVKSSR